MVNDWEAEVVRQAALREEARRERCRQAAAELIAQIRESSPLQATGPSKIDEKGPRRGSMTGGWVGALVGAVTEHGTRRGSVLNTSSKCSQQPNSKAPPGMSVQDQSTGLPLIPTPTSNAPLSSIPDLNSSPTMVASNARRQSIFAYTQREDIASGALISAVECLTVPLRNGLDPQSSDRKQMVRLNPVPRHLIAPPHNFCRMHPSLCLASRELRIDLSGRL